MPKQLVQLQTKKTLEEEIRKEEVKNIIKEKIPKKTTLPFY